MVETCDLLIEVQIERSSRESFYGGQSNKKVYMPPKHKIYIFTLEGELVDEHGFIKFGDITR
jgi:hypothetical protein